MPEDHALLSASGSKRWLMCPPSARLEEKFEETSSIYADEGTFGHSLAEFKLRCFIEVKSKSARESEYQQLSQHKYYSKELEDAVDFYVDVVKEQLAAAQAKDPGAILLLEQKLDLSAYAPESFGTGDAVIITEDEVIVMDLKMGKGVKVEGAANSQMRLYGLGALDAYRCMYELTQVTTIVVQPRLDNVSGETMMAADLALWGESIKPRARAAFAGEGEFCYGDHCRFCRAKAVCRARGEANLELAAKYDTGKSLADPRLLDTAELAYILGKIEEFSAWAKDVGVWALEQAKRGVKYPGFKLVEGRSNRKIMDAKKAIEILEALKFRHEQYMTEPELRGITDLEKLAGKKQFIEALGHIISKPAGAPTLVPESDKRAEINGNADTLQDFDVIN
ncbi:MAG: DUF2800 domain-containing protein [Negativicutes bacterium]